MHYFELILHSKKLAAAAAFMKLQPWQTCSLRRTERTVKEIWIKCNRQKRLNARKNVESLQEIPVCVDGSNNKWHKGNQVNVCYNSNTSSSSSNGISSTLMKLDVSDCSVHSYSQHTNSDTVWDPHGAPSGVNFMDLQLVFSSRFDHQLLFLLLNGNGRYVFEKRFNSNFTIVKKSHETNGH